MYSVNVSQVATVSFEGVISDIGSKDPLSFATVQLLHGDEVHSVLSKDNGVFSFPSVHPGDYILRITYVGYDRYEKRVTLKRDTKLIVNVENTLMETIGQQVFSVPVHAGKGYTLTLPVVATYPGLLKISVSRVYIKDLMGFFRLKKNVEQTAELSILPRAVTDIAYEKTALEQGMLESEESSKRGNDFSDVQEVREYIPGDKLMSIHWKLSAKRDILMVKDRVSMSDHQLVIVPELFIDQPVNLAAILTMTYSVILELIQEQTTVRLLYWSTNRYEYEDVRIDYKEELDAAFARLYYEKAYKNPSEAADHMALVHPEMHAYLHVFSDGQGAQMQVRENE